MKDAFWDLPLWMKLMLLATVIGVLITGIKFFLSIWNG